MSAVAEVIEPLSRGLKSDVLKKSPPKGGKKIQKMIRLDSYSGDNSATSEMEEEEERKGQKRRRKRKRTLSRLEKSIKFKAAQIEKALHSKDSLWAGEDTVSYDDDVSSTTEDKGMTLRELAIADHGLINDDLRRRAWPRLVNLNIYATCLLPTQEEVENHNYYNQVVLDVKIFKN